MNPASDPFRYLLNGARHLGQGAATLLKPPSFDAVDPEAGRKPVEDSRQFHRLGEAEMMGRTAPKAAGNRVGVGVPDRNLSRHLSADYRVDHNHGFGASPLSGRRDAHPAGAAGGCPGRSTERPSASLS